MVTRTFRSARAAKPIRTAIIIGTLMLVSMMGCREKQESAPETSGEESSEPRVEAQPAPLPEEKPSVETHGPVVDSRLVAPPGLKDVLAEVPESQLLSPEDLAELERMNTDGYVFQEGVYFLPGRGRLIVTIQDFTFPLGDEFFQFSRTWTGLNKGGLLGPGWTSSFASGAEGDDLGSKPTRINVGREQLEISWDGDCPVTLISGGETVLQFTCDREARLTGISGPGGNTLKQLEYREGFLVSETDSDGRKIGYVYDSKGNLSRIIQDDGPGAAFTFGSDGRLREVDQPGLGKTLISYVADGETLTSTLTNPLGSAMTWRFSEDNTVITDFEGGVTEKQRDSQGRLLRYRDPGGGEFRAGWDREGRLISFLAPGRPEVEVEYDNMGFPAAMTAGARRESVEYDLDGMLVRITDTLGRVTSLVRDDQGRIVSLQRGDDWARKLGRDELGRVVLVDEGSGRREERAFDRQGRVVRHRDVRGGETRLTWDDGGHLLTQTNPLGQTRRWEYEKGRLSSMVDEAGVRQDFIYSQAGRLVGVTRREEGADLELRHDSLGRIREVVEPRGGVSYQYDGMNRVIGVKSDHEYSLERDQAGRIIRIRSDGRTVYSASWDDRGFLISEAGEDGEPQRYTWDGEARLVGIDHRGAATRMQYDEQGLLSRVTRVAGITDPGMTVTYTRDGNGRVIETRENQLLLQSLSRGPGGLVEAVSEGGVTTRLEYDPAGQLIAAEVPGAEKVSFNWDLLGRLSSYTSSSRGNLSWTYDPRGRIVSWGSGPGAGYQYSYGPGGNLVSASFGGQQVFYEWDGQARLSAARNSLGEVTRFSYDPRGNLKTRTNPDGSVRGFSFDQMGRISEVVREDGAAEQYQFDDKGLLTRISVGGEPVAEFHYDARARLVESRGLDHDLVYSYSPDGRTGQLSDRTASLVLAKGLDAGGRVSAYLLPDGSSIRYSRDEHGRITDIEGPAGAGVHLRYDPAGRRSRIDLGGGAALEYKWNDRGQALGWDLLGANSQILKTLTYTWDEAGRVGSRSFDGIETRYYYDDAGRLKRVERGTDTSEFSYDALGNLVGLAGRQLPRPGISDTVGAVSTLWSVLGNLSGRTVDEDKLELSYGPTGRLTRVQTGNGLQVEYGYDPHGNLLWRRQGEQELRWLNDQGNPVAEYEGRLLRRIYLTGDGLDERFAVVQEGKTLFYLRDLAGNVLGMVDEAGQVQGLTDYDPFGMPRSADESANAGFGFQSRYRDPATGLINFRHRWYDPKLGLFIRPDPMPQQLARPQSLNRYAFLENDPVNNIDPLGLEGYVWEVGKTCLEGVCNLFQKGQINSSYAFGNALDGFTYNGAIEKSGWVYDVWTKHIPGSNQAVTIIRDLSEKASGPYGGANFTGNLMVRPDAPQQAAETVRTAESSGSTLGNMFQSLKQGVQAYGKEITGTIGGLGGLSGTLGTSVNIISKLPGGLAIIGMASAFSGAVGYAIGTGLNQLKPVQSGAQYLVNKTMGYNQDQLLVNLQTQEAMAGDRARQIQQDKVAKTLAELKSQGMPLDAPEAGVAQGTIDLNAPVAPASPSEPVPPEAAPEVKPEVAPEVKPEVAPEVKPEVAPEVKPEAVPEPEATPAPGNEAAEPPPAGESGQPVATGSRPHKKEPGTQVEEPEDDPGEPGQEEEEPEEPEEPEEDPEEEEELPTPEPPSGSDGDLLKLVNPIRVTGSYTTQEDHSYREFSNIVTCTFTLSFWNVGNLVPGYGEASFKGKCVASLNGSYQEYSGGGSFSGGPNGRFRMTGDGETVEFSLSGGARAVSPTGTYKIANPDAFANWPAGY